MNTIKSDHKTKIAYYKLFWLPILLLFFGFIFFVLTYVFEVKNFGTIYTIFKGLTSACFLGSACFWYLKIKPKQKLKNHLFLAFVFMCFISDIGININFVLGMGLFFIAHLLYIASCFFIVKINLKKTLWYIPIYVLSLILINLMFGLKIFNQNTILWVFTNFYALVLATSLVYTIYIYLEYKNIHTYVQLIAISLFVTSDILLMFNSFLEPSYLATDVSNTLSFFVLLLYYSSMNINAYNLKNI